MTSLMNAALAYAAKGIPVFPVGKGKEGKAPFTQNGFHDASTDPEKIRAWWTRHPSAKIGTPCGRASGILVTDIDCHPGKPSGFEHLPNWADLSDHVVKTAGGGRHLYHADDGKTAIAHPFPGVEVRGEGHYVILAGSGGYEWERGGDLKDLKPVPEFLLKNGKTSRGKTRSRRMRERPIPASLLKLCEGRWGKGCTPIDDDDLPDFELIVQAINIIPNPDLPWGEWKRIVMAIWAAFLGNADGLAAAHAFSRNSKKYDAAGTDQAWEEVTGSPPSDLSAGTLIWLAEQASPARRDEQPATQAEGPSTQTDETAQAETAQADEPLTSDWPTMGEAAYHGIIGEVVKTIEPESEADPVAILIQLIVAAGSMIGRQAYYQVESDRHHPNLFAAAVGDTSKARKGTSWGRVREVAYHADQDWVLRHIGSGLSSGEGLIHQVRDQVEKPNKDGVLEVTDVGVRDKRFMALEAELSGLLKVMERPGSTISPLFRKAWDGGDLQTLTRNSALKATAPHVSSIGHITIEELRSCLTRTDAANGFANRFLFFLVRRSKELPMGGSLDDEVIKTLGKRIGAAITYRMVDADGFRVKFSSSGEARWREVYGRLTKGHPGMFGAVTARGEAQVIRIALIYAVIDKSDLIEVPHVDAGLAVWDYCERSAKYIFGEMLGDNVADTILDGLKRVHPAGLSRSEIYRDLFGSNARASAIGAALGRRLPRGWVSTVGDELVLEAERTSCARRLGCCQRRKRILTGGHGRCAAKTTSPRSRGSIWTRLGHLVGRFRQISPCPGPTSAEYGPTTGDTVWHWGAAMAVSHVRLSNSRSPMAPSEASSELLTAATMSSSSGRLRLTWLWCQRMPAALRGSVINIFGTERTGSSPTNWLRRTAQLKLSRSTPVVPGSWCTSSGECALCWIAST